MANLLPTQSLLFDFFPKGVLDHVEELLGWELHRLQAVRPDTLEVDVDAILCVRECLIVCVVLPSMQSLLVCFFTTNSHLYRCVN